MKRIIDLSHLMEEKMITFDAPWHKPFTIQQTAWIEKQGRQVRNISFGTHTGTHIDAPLHFIMKGRGIDNISLERLCGPVSITDYTHLEENQPITKDMLKQQQITKRMLFKFGWAKYWNDKEKFYNNYPFFTEEAARYLVEKDIYLIGFDSPSPDDSRIKPSLEDGAKVKLGSQNDSPVHKILLANDIIILEYVANLDDVTDYEGWSIVVAPLKIRGADGCPSRVFIYK